MACTGNDSCILVEGPLINDAIDGECALYPCGIVINQDYGSEKYLRNIEKIFAGSDLNCESCFGESVCYSHPGEVVCNENKGKCSIIVSDEW